MLSWPAGSTMFIGVVWCGVPGVVEVRTFHGGPTVVGSRSHLSRIAVFGKWSHKSPCFRSFNVHARPGCSRVGDRPSGYGREARRKNNTNEHDVTAITIYRCLPP